MKSIVLYMSLAVIFLSAGCSVETAKRAAYDSLQNMSDMNCRDKPGADCREQQSYDDYQRALKKQ